MSNQVICNHMFSTGIKLNGTGKSEGYIIRTCVYCGKEEKIHNPSKEQREAMKKFVKLLGVKLV